MSLSYHIIKHKIAGGMKELTRGPQVITKELKEQTNLSKRTTLSKGDARLELSWMWWTGW
jgi:hypothetical protein